MTDEKENIELRVMRAMKTTLLNVIKDTTSQPGQKHPLADGTIEDIRQCLGLITAREQELTGDAGKHRPRFIDEPEDSVVVSLKTPEKD
ncbi:segregation and condensation protein A [Sulfuriflexus sp.]|uniref:segregation and condensation protein A n=1 Tax=Sulfuriflexus sp. TaxID=2015443 RepID=UPI0028CFC155|nr:segregation and condensation protein A [Sulfuriflexus sp.]MDT8403699.1 segregation and condensation protein A [Sulfuriflexus sp.]